MNTVETGTAVEITGSWLVQNCLAGISDTCMTESVSLAGRQEACNVQTMIVDVSKKCEQGYHHQFNRIAV